MREARELAVALLATIGFASLIAVQTHLPQRVIREMICQEPPGLTVVIARRSAAGDGGTLPAEPSPELLDETILRTRQTLALLGNYVVQS